MRRALLPALLLLIAGCGPQLRPPAVEIPDLRGTWEGTWGGTPLRLLVLEQRGTAAPGGIEVGPWSIFGERLPALSGVLTFTVRGEPTSINVHGRLGDLGGRLTLVLDGLTPSSQRLVLRRVADGRLAGEGTSRPTWEPQGPVELVRLQSGGDGPTIAPPRRGGRP